MQIIGLPNVTHSNQKMALSIHQLNYIFYQISPIIIIVGVKFCFSKSCLHREKKYNASS